MASASGGPPGAVRIANCSGLYGDRLSAMREMLTGGSVHYLTGDYLAELTKLILGRDKMKHSERGYTKTFLTQLEDCLGEARDRGVHIVANAGGATRPAWPTRSVPWPSSWASRPASSTWKATTCCPARPSWGWALR